MLYLKVGVGEFFFFFSQVEVQQEKEVLVTLYIPLKYIHKRHGSLIAQVKKKQPSFFNLMFYLSKESIDLQMLSILLPGFISNQSNSLLVEVTIVLFLNYCHNLLSGFLLPCPKIHPSYSNMGNFFKNINSVVSSSCLTSSHDFPLYSKTLCELVFL